MVQDNSHKALGVVSEGTDELHSEDKGFDPSATPPTHDLADQEPLNFNHFLNKDLPRDEASDVETRRLAHNISLAQALNAPLAQQDTPQNPQPQFSNFEQFTNQSTQSSARAVNSDPMIYKGIVFDVKTLNTVRQHMISSCWQRVARLKPFNQKQVSSIIEIVFKQAKAATDQ